MSRKLARERAFMFLYSLEIQTEDYAEQRDVFIKEWRLSGGDTDYFDKIVTGVLRSRAELDQIIEPRLVGWALPRIPKVDLTIMRMALYEMMHFTDVPSSVSISEAVILAGKYSDEKSRSYINAVLGNLEREEDYSRQKQELNQDEIEIEVEVEVDIDTDIDTDTDADTDTDTNAETDIGPVEEEIADEDINSQSG